MLQNYKILNFFKNKKIILSLISVFLLSSCVETIVISSGVGAGLAYREKTIEDTRSDLKISTKIASKFIANGLKNPTNSVDITVNEARVMLTGIVDNVEKAKLAQELCWQVKGVNEVIDEIQIRKDGKFKVADIGVAFYDYLITAEIETKFALAKDLRFLNYQITTVNNEVYLMGVALDSKEMNRAVSIASKVRGVKKVINHILLADDSRRG